jgi:4-carboxymuconolactone decarboxylase
MTADPPPRMAPIPPEQFSGEARVFLDRWSGGSFSGAETNPVLQTFAHHPLLADLFSQLNVHLLTTSSLPLKQRQIAIMRTAWRCKAVYMWSSHLNLSLMRGLDPAMFAPVQTGADDPWFSGFERAIVRATDELVDDRRIGDASWQVLSAEWSHQQLLDFMFTVGCYVAIAGVMRSTGVQRQPDLIALAETYGAPEA